MNRFCRTYEQAIEFICSRINYERVSDRTYSAGDLKLDRMRQLLSMLGDPQERLPVIHVAGTKGKGSTSVMAAEILSAAGYRTGLFTSPHISAFEERLTVGGRPPSSEQFVELVNRLVAPIEEMDRSSQGHGPTYFELATALAWLYFLECAADVAVLEVGLGGRLDATNICRPLLGIITNVSRDHTNVLGSTVAQIAREKAGIVKPGIPLLSGVAPGAGADVVAEVCRREGSTLYRLGCEIHWRLSELGRPDRDAPANSAVSDDAGGALVRPPLAIDVDSPWGQWRGIPVPLRGLHQGANAALAIGAIGLLSSTQTLRIPPQAIEAGLSAVRWPARVEVIGTRPTVIVDAAHNWASAEALVQTLESEFSARRSILVFAATRDKDVSGMLRLLLPRFDSVILTQYQPASRGVSVDELAALARRTGTGPFHVAADAATAWRLARHIASADDLICVTGSFFIAAELRDVILDHPGARAPRPEVDRSGLSNEVRSQANEVRSRPKPPNPQ